MNAAIKIENLIKQYNDNAVIKGISFEVFQGEIFGILGTNGAGKTTTLECIEGIRKYDKGKINVNGTIGVQLQSASLPKNIKVIEAFKLFSKWNNKAINLNLFNAFGLSEIRNIQYNAMSTGQKRRLHLALSLINDPKIIFLDEPTAGLDVEGRVSLHDEIRKLNKQGKTIIIASHDMAEVEELCHRVAILRDGNIAFIGTPEQLTSTITSKCKIYIKAANALKNENLQFASYDCTQQGYEIFIGTNVGDTLFELLSVGKAKKNTIVDIKIERATLEQGFMNIAKEG